MVNSMTGYGHSEFQVNKAKFSATIKSVNSKFLEININLPLDFQYMEAPLSKAIKTSFTRGKFDVYIGVDKSTLRPKVELNEGLLEEYLKLIERIDKKVGFHKEISLADIVNFGCIVITKNTQERIKFNGGFAEGFQVALNHLRRMRRTEGRSIHRNFVDILNNMSCIIKLIKKNLPRIIQDYQKRLRSKIEDLVDTRPYDESRILAEVALFSDRIDISEEMERLKSHLVQMKRYASEKKPCGKLTEFLLQEMLRECNTIGSKASNIETTRDIIVLKESVEKMREQARNVE